MIEARSSRAPAQIELRVPDHVPPELVRDIDIYALGGDRDPLESWTTIHEQCPPIFYIPHHGGCWVLNSAELIERVSNDHINFSSLKGIFIPPLPKSVPPLVPLQSDPPEHRGFRRPFNVAISPKKIAELKELARADIIARIESFANTGRCDFIADLAAPVPVSISLRMLGFPFEDREVLMPWASVLTHSSDLEEREKAIRNIT